MTERAAKQDSGTAAKRSTANPTPDNARGSDISKTKPSRAVVQTAQNADVHYAQSGIYTPSDFPFARDAIAAESGENVETLVFNDVDLEVLRRQRDGGTVTTWRDRRLDVYRVRYREPDGTELDV